MKAIDHDFGFNAGISCIRYGHFDPNIEHSYAIASQTGELKIVSLNDDNLEWSINNQFDLSENGAIWYMECSDIDGDGIDEILIGGMQGALVCLSSKGDECWVHRCESAISGIKIWKNHRFENLQAPAIIVISLDRTVRVLDGKTGKMVWAQMFASGVACVSVGDANGDGNDEVVAGGNDGTVRLFDGKTGKMLWFQDMKVNVRAVIIGSGRVICGGDNKKLSIMDGMKGTVLYEREFPTFVWNIVPLPSSDPKSQIGNTLFISTYSFRYIDMDEGGGEPTVGVYRIENLKLIQVWENEKVNAQDSVIGRSVLIGDTSGRFLILQLANGALINPDASDLLPSMINTVAISPIFEKDALKQFFCLAGCDDKKVYITKIVIN